MKRLLPILALLCANAQPALAQTHLIVISGLAGETEFRELFQDWSQRLIDAIQGLGVAESHIVHLSATGEDQQRSTKANIEAAFTALSQRVSPGDGVLVVLIGHGSAREGEALFNIPGPDISADEFAELLQPLTAQKIAFVNTTPSSGPFIEALSGQQRVILTATAHQAERYHTLFGGHFVEAFTGPGADTDKNNRVSLLEAFDYARREVRRVYESENRLPTEHALLDDNGDGKGSQEADLEQGDGALARAWFIEGGAASLSEAAASDPELAALLDAKTALLQQIDSLKRQKTEWALEAYEDRLEALLVELALNKREIRAREGQP